MLRNIKYGKISLAVFLTVLIWVWADLQKTEEFNITGADVHVARPANPDIWVSFEESLPSIPIKTIDVTGTSSRIDQIRRRLRKRVGFHFEFDAAQWRMTEPRTLPHQLNLLDFLRKDKQIRALGLKVESCEPETVSVRVVELVKKKVDVQCVDKEGRIIGATVNPPQVEISVPKGEERSAKVQLSPTDIEQARIVPVSKVPYFELAPNEIRKASKQVEITVQYLLKNWPISSPTLGFTLSENLQGRFEVEVHNWSSILGAGIRISATRAAKVAYESMPYQVILEILDQDKELKAGEPFKKRELIYNFPPDHVSRKEIQLIGQKVEAHFTLKPLTVAPSPPPTGQ
jgi:hypothetical protein